MRVLTLNIWGLSMGFAKDRAFRVLALGKAFQRLQADVIALQEVWLEKDKIFLVEQAHQAGLPYHAYFRSGLLGSGLLTLSRYPIIETAFQAYRLSGRAERVLEGDFYAGKGVGLARIESPDGVIDVYNTHPQAQYEPDESAPYHTHRSAAQYEMARFINRHSGQYPVIAMGDFNVQPHQLGYHILCELAALTDTHTYLNKDDGYTISTDNPYVSNRKRPERIDYIFVRGITPRCAEVTMTQIPDAPHLPYSDHYGILAEVDPQTPLETPYTDPQPGLELFLERLVNEQEHVGLRRRHHYIHVVVAFVIAIVFNFRHAEATADRWIRLLANLTFLPFGTVQFILGQGIIGIESRQLHALEDDVRHVLQRLSTNMLQSEHRNKVQ